MSSIKHFVIPQTLAEALGICKYRYGNAERGYLVNVGDLAVYGIDKAITEGAVEIGEVEARNFVKSFKQ